MKHQTCPFSNQEGCQRLVLIGGPSSSNIYYINPRIVTIPADDKKEITMNSLDMPAMYYIKSRISGIEVKKYLVQSEIRKLLKENSHLSPE